MSDIEFPIVHSYCLPINNCLWRCIQHHGNYFSLIKPSTISRVTGLDKIVKLQNVKRPVIFIAKPPVDAVSFIIIFFYYLIFYIY